ncbi:MAG: polysaccharide deacetylase family protein [Alicyclobacillus sp.]|nr:polysaccharide deacetylase family protein [Alicyclobacillus sp.]
MKRAGQAFASVLGVGMLTAAVTGCAPEHPTAAAPTPVTSKTIHLAAAASDDVPGATVRVQPLDMHHLNVDLSHHIYYQDKVVVVTFHDISPRVYSPFVITPQQFSADLNAIHAHFNVITNQQFIDFLNHRGTVPPNAVLLTFDDGYRDMYTYALPALVQHEMQGTFFDIVGSLDSKIHGEFLKPYQVQQMAHDGMVFESHTYQSHYEVKDAAGQLTPVFDTRIVVDGKLETPAQYVHRVYTDFYKARTELSHLTGEPVTEFAWPYGYGTPIATYLANRAGYQYLFTTNNGYVTAYSNRDYLDRIDIGKPFITPAEAVQDIIDTANPPTHFHRLLHHLETVGHASRNGDWSSVGKVSARGSGAGSVKGGSSKAGANTTTQQSAPKLPSHSTNSTTPGTNKV